MLWLAGHTGFSRSHIKVKRRHGGFAHQRLFAFCLLYTLWIDRLMETAKNDLTYQSDQKKL